VVSRGALTLAEKEGKERLVALQLEYSLVERNIEREHVPAHRNSALVLPLESVGRRFSEWKVSTSGQYRTGRRTVGDHEGSVDSGVQRFKEGNWQILDVVLTWRSRSTNRRHKLH